MSKTNDARMRRALIERVRAALDADVFHSTEMNESDVRDLLFLVSDLEAEIADLRQEYNFASRSLGKVYEAIHFLDGKTIPDGGDTE